MDERSCVKALEYRDGVTCSPFGTDAVCANHQVIAGLRKHAVDADNFEHALRVAVAALKDIRGNTPTLYADARANEAIMDVYRIISPPPPMITISDGKA